MRTFLSLGGFLYLLINGPAIAEVVQLESPPVALLGMTALKMKAFGMTEVLDEAWSTPRMGSQGQASGPDS